MIRAGLARGKFWRVSVALSLVLSLLSLLVTPAVADEPLVPRFNLQKIAQPSPVFTSSPLVYTLTITNIGKAPSQQAIITDVVPSGVTLTSVGQNGVFDSNQITWTLPYSLPINASTVVTFTVQTANVAGVVVNASYGVTDTYALTPTFGIPLDTVVLPRIVVNEIMQNPSQVYDDKGEWFELYNPTAAEVDLNGWTIKDNDTNSHVINNGGPLLIAPNGYLVLGNNADSATNGGVQVDYAYPSSWVLANGDDEVILLDANLNEIDRVEYDGGPQFPDPTGASMALADPALDNNVGANWYRENTIRYGDGDYGTPGWRNGAPPFDTEPPYIISTDPQDGETGIDFRTNVRVTFNEAINENTLDFILSEFTNAIPGSVSYEPATRTATFDPDDPLNFQTTYMATIGAGLQDLSGNTMTDAYTWSFTTGDQPLPAPVLISEVQVRGSSSAADEFIELYNPSRTQPFNLNGYRIVYQANTGNTSTYYTWSEDAIIPPYRHYLLVNDRYNGSVSGDATYTQGLADNGAVAIVRSDIYDLGGEVIDSVGWGNVNPAIVTFVENSPAPLPGAEQSIERLPGGEAGNMQDTYNNSADFQTLDPPNPQNLISPPTPFYSMTSTIAEARALPDNSLVTVEGIATAPSGIYDAGSGNTQFYIQDGTGGAQIQVLGSHGPLPQVTLGDRIVVSGVTGHDRGEFQIVPQDNAADITVTDGDPGAVPAPRQVAIADVGEGSEGWLIALQGRVIEASASGQGYDVRLADDQGHETFIYIDNLTGIDTSGIIVGLFQEFVGISTQLDEHYQTKPRIQPDVPQPFDQQGPCPAPAATAPGPLIISAAYYDTTFSSYVELGEAVQVMNTGQTAVSLAGLYLSDNEAQAALPDLWLEPGQAIWLARQEARFTLEFGFAPAWAYGDLAPGLLFDNNGDEALLLSADGAVIDAIVIQDGCAAQQSGWNDSHGVSPYLFASYVPADGQILYRKLDEGTRQPLPDTDTAADWAQDPDDGVLGRRVRYPGWDVAQFFFPPMLTEDATTTLLVAPDNMYDGIAALIAEAQHTIDLELYLFTHPLLADELVAAMDRGVHVRLLLEGEVYGAPDGTWDSARWVAKQVADHPNGEVYFWRDGQDDAGVALADRYNNAHQKFIVVDGIKAAILSENLGQTSMPADDKSDGTAGNRGVGVITTAPGVVAHLQAVFAADLDPTNHRDVDAFTPGRDDVRHEAGHEGEPLLRPDVDGNRTGYTPVRPESLTLRGETPFQVVQSPETSLRTSDALLGLVARADGDDLLLVQQQYEHQNWGPEGATFLNPRLKAYLEAARRGATVRILLANDDAQSDEDDLIQFLNDLATAEGLDLLAGKGEPTAGWQGGEPQSGNIHNKMVLLYDRDSQGWSHVGSINGSENASKYNREMALQIGSDAAFNYYAGVFYADWLNSGLPGFLDEPLVSFELSDDTPAVGQTVVFTNNTTGSPPILFEWDFGDGSPISNAVNPVHVYDAPGDYTISLRAVNPTGESSATATVQVGYAPQAAFATHPAMPLPGQSVQFINQSTGAEPLTYLWDFGDGATSDKANPSHTYTEAGSYVVTLTASNLWGEDTATDTISVYKQLGRYVIDHMVIRWHRFDDLADFTLAGQLKLPPSYSQEDLDKKVILSIEIAGRTFWQQVQLAAHDRLWYLLRSGDGQGMNLQNVGILWQPNSQPASARLFIIGRLNVPGLDQNTRPRVATVTLKLLAKPDQAPVHGRQRIQFRAFQFWWFYSRWLGGFGVEGAMPDDWYTLPPWLWETRNLE